MVNLSNGEKNPSRQVADRMSLSRIYYLTFTLTVKAATLIFISWCGSASSSAKEGNII